MVSRRALAAAVLGLSLGLGGCVTGDDPSGLDRVNIEVPYPAKVAVLPFRNLTPEREASEVVRRLFFNFFSSLTYLDAEISTVDRVLRDTGRFDAVVSGHDLALDRLCQDLGVDGVIVGQVEDFSKVYALIYTHTAVRLSVELKDCRTGSVLWAGSDSRTDREGSLPTDLGGLAMGVAQTFFSYNSASVAQTATLLTMKMVEQMPAPPVVSDAAPTIRLLVHNGVGRFVKPGESLRVGLIGDPGQIASWDLDTVASGLPLEERSPGVYVGAYRVGPDDRLVDARVIGRLSTRSGAAATWVDYSSGVNMGTWSPAPRVVTEDTTLRAEDGPYLVEDVLLVREGATLTLEPGTVLWGLSGGLVVRGQLAAVGTPDAPVRILGSGAADWKGLLIHGPEAAATLDHAVLTSGEFGLKVVAGQADVRRTEILDNTWGAVIDGGTLTLADAIVVRSGRAGVSVKDGHLDLSRTLVAENAGGGLQLSNATVATADNDILGNALWDAKNHDTTPVTLPNTWWGSTDAATVRAEGLVTVEPLRPRSWRDEQRRNAVAPPKTAPTS